MTTRSSIDTPSSSGEPALERLRSTPAIQEGRERVESYRELTEEALGNVAFADPRGGRAGRQAGRRRAAEKGCAGEEVARQEGCGEEGAHQEGYGQEGHPEVTQGRDVRQPAQTGSGAGLAADSMEDAGA